MSENIQKDLRHVEVGGKKLEEGELGRMGDDKLRALRATFIEKRTDLQKLQKELPEADRYSSPDAARLWQDIEYYNQLIRSCEYEMQSRYLTLD